ncbi:4'-phosphopantetheinyl transferase superfamily protein [Streptomyces sp. NPDC051219]|uniref:4'-phosphopantetheinyl transferase family protein n=1 Tax=Streptomyces sp. NPDC051219 TaxID=3155283 RepID=UPI0034477DED
MHTAFEAITPGRIHRWGTATLIVARRTPGPTPPRSPLPFLTPDERHLYQALAPRRQTEWAAGRLLAKHLIHHHLATPPTDVEILPRHDGSPHPLINGRPIPGLNLSISHTTHHVAAALAPDPVGIDLCETTSAPTIRRVADHILTPHERTHTIPDHPHTLTAAWALKEAAVKADRHSIHGTAPRHIHIHSLTPPTLSGPRHAMLWHTTTALLALVTTPHTAHDDTTA